MVEINSVLITGANRGIGLEFVRQFLTNTSVRTHIIIATYRSQESSSALLELAKSTTRVYTLKFDVNQFDAYEKFVNDVQSIVGDKGLTLLINNAGICVPFCDTLDDVTPEKFTSVFTTNATAPVILTKVLRPLLKQSARIHSDKNNGLSIARAAVINISSIAGSCAADIGPLSLYAYRESKAALNMSTISMAIELEKDGILVESLHPGVVDTDMTATHTLPKIDATTSVAKMIEVLLSLNGKNKEGFPSYDGRILPF
nr:PREDICTED: uncharacterized protein LOC109038099 [Bemisia tabaci]